MKKKQSLSQEDGTVKKMVETLRSDGCKATGVYEAAASELEQSKARVELLEELVGKLNGEVEDEKAKVSSIEAEFASAKLEVEQLRSALAVAEMRRNEDQAQSAEQVKHACEIVEQIKSTSGQREAQLEAELRKCSYEIEELRSNLMDKETELQSIFEENDALIMQLENALSGHREHELRAENETIKAQYHNISEENRALRKEMEAYNSTRSEAMSELEAARVAEREALVKVGSMTEEVDRSNRKAARVAEQLEAAQAANAEMEAELRKLKVQSDQWRKAAEVAASMLAVGNNGHAVERTGSMDNKMRNIPSSNADDLDNEMFKKKNVNVLRKFGVLWKKPQK
ncbi:interactor of constitutive active ROPs 3-like [Salvia splendens]|uniref:interactor of constitutive active ROPs 3-like n=1 Tax=Salvia splendens TaxID=180675 RepID=UPI001C2544EC|nr:interactor of constitutive active ROPs 3-like [Salvia splendens]